MDVGARVQTPKFGSACTVSLNLYRYCCFVLLHRGYFLYPSSVVLNTPWTMLPIYTQDFKAIGLGLKDNCIHYFFSCFSFWGTELEFSMLSYRDKSKKHNYKPEAISSLSTAVSQEKLVHSLYPLCLDLSVVVYNSQGRFLISATGINGLPRISGLH